MSESAPEFLTPTQLAKRVGVPSQMIYNYLKMGMIHGAQVEVVKLQWAISAEEADRWSTKYLESKAIRESK